MIHVDQRRRSARMSTAYPVRLFDHRGKYLARGRTANISENGAFVLVMSQRNIPADGRLILHITLPDVNAGSVRREKTRTVAYVVRIVHMQKLGRLVGLGVELVKKLA